MKLIASETGVDYDEDALGVIARAAEVGCVMHLVFWIRLSHLGMKRLLLDDALAVTGAVSQVFLLNLAEAINDHDVVSGLESLEELLSQGKDPTRFIEDFIMFYRDMLLYKTAPNLDESLECDGLTRTSNLLHQTYDKRKSISSLRVK